MREAVLLFTFSPIQSFISEARRASDLFAASKILSRLAYAAAQPLLQPDQASLVYPAQPNPDDMPNKLVAIVPFDQAQSLAEQCRQSLLEEWQAIAQTARQTLSALPLKPDALWQEIWERQCQDVWEIYWVAQKLNGDYSATFQRASAALDAVKRTRPFAPAHEEGLKDTLSGQRSALRLAEADARKYWAGLAKSLPPSRLRPGGKERLDALGAVKRFASLATQATFASVSSVAVADTLAKFSAADPQAAEIQLLREYRRALQELLGEHLYRVRQDDLWPYDGDLLFLDTLTPNRLKDSYGVEITDPRRLAPARECLSKLYRQVGKPSPYYAVLLLDGDSMGEQIQTCQSTDQHRHFSQQLADFAAQVQQIADRHFAQRIYNGGDDVLALAPISQALPLAQALAQAFAETVKKPAAPDQSCSLSAGIAISHHLYPLDAALNAARQAEQQAKKVKGKNAVSVISLKRSGERVGFSSPWQDLGSLFTDLVALMQEDSSLKSALSSRFAYEFARQAYCFAAADETLQSELKRLLLRHRNAKRFPDSDVVLWAEKLTQWAARLPNGAEALANWLVFARFVAQGGQE